MRHRLAQPLVACVLLGLALRAPFITGALGSDESGLLLVVEGWDPSRGLYGEHWVDRPPLLLGYFWLAALVADTTGVRLLGGLASALVVGSAVLLGDRLGGKEGAWQAGLVGAALGSSYLLVGHEMNGMLQAAALVTASCCLTVLGVTGRHPLPSLAAAGALAAAAVLVKQNSVDALGFGLVVLGFLAARGHWARRRAATAAAAFVGGALLVAGCTLAWLAATGVDLGEWWYAMYEFRLEAAERIAQDSMEAPLSRLGTLVVAFVVSGLAVVVVRFLLVVPALVRHPATRPLAAGAVTLLCVALAGITLGGSWWRHYLLQLVPAAVVMVALSGPVRGGARWARLTTAYVVGAALVATVAGVARAGTPPEEVLVAQHVRAGAHPGDTGVVVYGSAEVLLHSGLRSPYEHLWSLPMRVLDPGLQDLVAELEGPDPPTWIIQLHPFDSWGVDSSGSLREAVQRRYRRVGSPCGSHVYVLRGVTRHLPATDPCSADLHLVARL